MPKTLPYNYSKLVTEDEIFTEVNNCLANDKCKDARRHLRKILKKDKDNAMANMLLGDAYVGDRKLDEARKYYGRANNHKASLSINDRDALNSKISSLTLQSNNHRETAASAAVLVPADNLGCVSLVVTEDKQETPPEIFFAAIESGRLDIIQTYFQQGHTLKAENAGMTTLMCALWNKQWVVAEWIVLQEKHMLSHENSKKWTPMTLASAHGRPEIMQWLKDHGAAINEKNSAQNRPIDSAISNDQPESAEWLFEQGVSQLELTDDGGTILMVALWNGFWDMAERLVRKNPALLRHENAAKHTPMIWAAANGKLSIMQWLRNHGVSIHEKNSIKERPIDYAVFNSQSQSAEWLLKQRVSLLENYNNGATLLMLALWNRQWFIAEWLVRKNPALLRHESFDHHTPMTWAAIQGKTDIMQWLKEKGVALNEKNSIGRRPIDIAILYNRQESAQWLLYQGASLLENYYDGTTVLMLALWYGQWRMAKWLVRKNPALLRHESTDHHTPMTWAATSGRTDIMRWLKRRGVHFNETNSMNKNAQNCAESSNQSVVINWLNNQSEIQSSGAQAAQSQATYANNPYTFYANMPAGNSTNVAVRVDAAAANVIHAYDNADEAGLFNMRYQ